MHHPSPITHRKRMILSYLQILHHLGAKHYLPSCHHAKHPIGAQHMHTQLDLPHRQEALLLRQEGMLFVGVIVSLVFVATLPCCLEGVALVRVRSTRSLSWLIHTCRMGWNSILCVFGL
jgi:hypothetical protein